MDLLSRLRENAHREWQMRYGGPRFLPERQEDGTYSPGIGHTGARWPQGQGHDYCWDPEACISCGCGPNGPCNSHRNLAYINGWRK